MIGLKNSNKISWLYSFPSIIFFGCNLLLFLSWDFKIFTISMGLFFGVLYCKTKDIFVNLFILLLVTAQFQQPGKYYTFIVASINQYVYPGLPDGVVEGFGIVGSDIIAFGMLLILLRYLLTTSFAQIQKHAAMFNNSLIKIVFICWLIYFSGSLFSSAQFSMYSFFSTGVVIQYMKMIVSSMGVYILFQRKEFIRTVFPGIIAGLLLFQSALGIYQFISRGGMPLAPTQTVVVAEETSLFPRPQGTFSYANQYALIQTILLLLLLPYATTSPLARTTSLFALLSILLSQSRTAWIILFCAFALWQILHKKNLFKDLFPSAALRPSVVIIALTLPMIIFIERLIASGAFFDDYGGGHLRGEMIRDGLTLLSQTPLFGHGAETSVPLLFQELPKGYIQYFPFSIHLGYLQMAIESGALGTMVFFGPYIMLLRTYARNIFHIHASATARQSAHLGLLAILIYYCIQPIYGRVEFLYCGLVLGIALTAYNKRDDSYAKN